MTASNRITIEMFVPGGILPTDVWHIITNDGSCSRCRKDVPEEDVPLMLWSEDRQNMLIYCEGCIGVDADAISEDEAE